VLPDGPDSTKLAHVLRGPLRRHCRDGHHRDPWHHAGRRSQAVAAGIIVIVLGALWVARKVTSAPAPGSSR